ncbi:MAG TPA: GNAT family N-acetyltransferase [Bacteroidia bacterium]|nr:GNAT family N-acetyltransferase [Bacteroidia bacterium]
MPEFSFSPFPVLETERLILRRVEPADVAEMFVLRSDRQLMKFIPRPVAQSPDDALALIHSMAEGIAKNEMINWGMVLKSSGKVIGTVGFFRMKPEHFRAEIGYMLHGDFHGTGIMQEALVKAIAFGFQSMKLHSIEAVVDPANIASIRLLERNGFVREAYFRENEFFDGKFLDSAVYSLLNR